MPTTARSRGSPSAGSFRQRLRARLWDERTQFAALSLFVACVFAMGGGSRADIQSLIVLRPLAFLFAAYALLVIRPEQVRLALWPLVLLGLLALVAAIQLVPLPPDVWGRLPGRSLLLQIASDAGLPPGHRPLSLAPARTLNMLLSLCVPFAAVLLVAIQGEGGRGRIPAVLLVGGAVSALVAVAQLAGVGSGGLYFYRITNADFPVGLFANRNHQALMMAVMLVLIAEVLRRTRRAAELGPLVTMGLLFAGLVVLALVLVSGSRAGLLLMVIAGASSAGIVAQGPRQSRAKRLSGSRAAAWAAAVGLGASAVLASALFFSRAESLERLWAKDPLDDFRVQRMPLLLEMTRDHWAGGIGFGAFEGVYRRYESVDALTPFIFNQAHNDWLQFPMEGGIPALIILGLALALLAVRGRGVIAGMARTGPRGDFALLAILAMIAVASVVDYPLRTPIFMLVAAIAFTLVVRSPPAKHSR